MARATHKGALQAMNLLVIHVTRIGDTLLATPAIRAMARAWPQARITVMGHPKRVEVLDNLPHVHHVEPITKTRAPWRDRLRRRRWDCAVVFGFDPALIHYGRRVADEVVGWVQPDDSLNRCLTKAVPVPVGENMTAVERLLALPCEGFGIASAGCALDYRVRDGESAWARRRLLAGWPRRPNPLIGLVLESFPTKPYRDWPLSHWLTLCSRILATYPDAGFVLLGREHSRDKLGAFRARFGDRVMILVDQLSLRESGAVISLLDLYIGVDTGPTHLAGALQTVPLIGLYHCRHRAWEYAPLEHAALSAIDHPFSDEQCSPAASMAEISVETVLQQVKLRLVAVDQSDAILDGVQSPRRDIKSTDL